MKFLVGVFDGRCDRLALNSPSTWELAYEEINRLLKDGVPENYIYVQKNKEVISVEEFKELVDDS